MAATIKRYLAMLALVRRTEEFFTAGNFDADAVCDHSVGVCWCDYHRLRTELREQLRAHEGLHAYFDYASGRIVPSNARIRASLPNDSDPMVREIRAAPIARREAGR